MPFERKESPFDNDEALTEDYMPDTVLGRDEELDEISEVLQQLIDNEAPINTFIYGVSGTGKTVSVKYQLQELKQGAQNYDDISITFIYQNCESLSSSYQAAISLTNQLLKDDQYAHLHDQLEIDYETLPSSGLPKDTVYSIFFDALDHLTYEDTAYREQLSEALENIDQLENPPDLQIGADELIWLSKHPFDDVESVPSYLSFPPGFGLLVDAETDLSNTDYSRSEVLSGIPEDPTTLLAELETEFDIRSPDEVTNYVTVVLDEVDRIGSRDELLYEIPRAQANNRVSNIRPSVIGISNDVAYKESIQSKTDSSLRLKEITFRRYDANQLGEILHQRAELAFKDGAYDDEIVPLAAAHARQQGGDARFAIDLLHKAGVKAKNDGDDVVQKDHIDEANEEKERDRIYEVTSDLDAQQKVTLSVIMLHDLRDETPISRESLYPKYKQLSGELLDKTTSKRRVADYLKEMYQLGLLNRKDNYGGPGKSGYVYELDTVDYEMILRVLGETDPSGMPEGSDLLSTELIDELESFADGKSAVREATQTQSSVDSWK
ncbi:AAA family ATPase (plasmid) [Halarchaeum sp. CBA1220]|uniref:Cdc6/Cdc18 family protein n=1 Tax=Halarchaeum sp. CBA1220 TaxID=1853682 RepID=UPI000F3A8891|nr:AAA family ATPase [Halarchaeum sp. CBA1220]QLC35446.1 AAA family ATPase [Halarchaeum sp. CBA1220]